MGWSDKVDERRRARVAAGAGKAPPPQSQKLGPGQRTKVSPLFIAIAAGAVLIPLCQRLGWIDKLLDKLPITKKDKSKGGRSRFHFPGSRSKAGASSSSSPAPQQKGKQPPTVASSSLPRNKSANNKKNKARRAEKREERERKRDDIANGAASGSAGGPGTLPVSDGSGNRVVPLNNVPKDEEIIGGADGKTFTTHSKYKTSEMYARIRDERGGT